MRVEITTEAGEVIWLPEALAFDEEELALEIPAQEIPGRAGAVEYGDLARIRPRTLTLTGLLEAASVQEADAMAERIRAGLFGGGLLRIRRYEQADRYIRARAVGVRRDYQRGYFGGRVFALEVRFLANDPWWYATAEQNVLQSVSAAGAGWQVTQPGTCRLQQVRLEIACPSGAPGGLVNPQVTNLDTGDVAAWTGTIAPGEALALDGEERTAYKGQANVFAGTGEAWRALGLRLLPGVNHLQFTDDPLSSHRADIRLVWRPRYY